MSFTEVEQVLNSIGVWPIDSTTRYLIFANSNQLYRGNGAKLKLAN